MLIAAATGGPVAVGGQRARAATLLLENHPSCDVVIADDGLQHYRLARDVEICVIEGARRFGAGQFEPPIPVQHARHPDELSELAQTVNHMAGDIRQMLDAKRTLLLAMSHELRSPLTRARLNAELLPEDRYVTSGGGHFIGWANMFWPVASPERMVMVGTAWLAGARAAARGLRSRHSQS